MKREKWVKILLDNGWWLQRHGAKHDIYTNGKVNESVSYSKEINDQLIKKIMKRQGLE